MRNNVKIAELLPLKSSLSWELLEFWDSFDKDRYEKLLIAKQNTAPNGIHNFTPHAKAQLPADHR